MENYTLTGWISVDLTEETIIGSPGLYNVLGINNNKLEWRDFQELLVPGDRYRFDNILGALKNGACVDQHMRILKADRSIRMIRICANVVFGADSSPRRADGIITDITELSDARAIATYSQERYKNLLAVAACVVWRVSALGHPLPNECWTRLTGQSLVEQRGEGWIDAIHAEDRASIAKAWRDGLAAEVEFKLSFRLRRQDGAFQWHTCRLIPQFCLDGSLLEWIGGVSAIRGEVDSIAPLSQSPETVLKGNILRAARGALNWSVAQLAKSSGLSVSTIKRMEDNDNAKVRIKTIKTVFHTLKEHGILIDTSHLGHIRLVIS